MTQVICNDNGSARRKRKTGDAMEKRDLCMECFSLEFPDIDRTSADRCQYCGAQAITSGTDFLALSMGVQQDRTMCFSCSQEFHRFTGKAMERFPDGLSQQEQLAAIGDLRELADKHMKQWVSKRGNG